MAQDVAALNARFGISGKAEVIAGSGGLAAVRVMAPEAQGIVYLHGGHVASWTPKAADGEDVLWISGKSIWQADKPIRGGVPVCFPWFGPKAGDAAAPAHGFARLRAWELESIEEKAGAITVCVSLTSDAASKRWWPSDFVLRHRVTFGQELRMSLELSNTGGTEFSAEEAQHTYFAVGDVRQVRVRGLAGARYVDKADAMKEKTEAGEIIVTAETDRPYFDTASPVVLEDPSMSRRITLTKEGSRSTVVWNPWIAKAKAMPDFGDDEWPQMICIETCNVGPDAVKVKPGETKAMTSWLRVERM